LGSVRPGSIGRPHREGYARLVRSGLPYDRASGGGAAMTITIYHNWDCGTSRNTLAMIRQSGADPK